MTNTPDSITIPTGDSGLFLGYDLALDQYATTTFDSDTGLHVYAVELEAGLQYQVEITVNGDTFDPVLEMERFDGTLVGGTSTEDGATLRYSFIADQTDVYSMFISDDGLDDFYTQTYTVRVIASDWISADPETTTAEFNRGDVIQNGAIFVSSTDYLGDVDMIAMRLEGGKNYGFFLGGYNPQYDPRLTIYDRDGETNLKQLHKYNKVTSFNYTPDEDGVYYFEARDNLGNDMGAYIAGVYSRGQDTLHGSSNDDVIVSGGGNDWVVTFNGEDTVYGGPGSDTVNGGGGSDSIVGGYGDDSLMGGSETDTIFGSAGNDTVNGGTGADSIGGGDGNDSLMGGNSTDTVYGANGNDTVAGGGGADSLFGGDGADTLNGGTHADTIQGGNANDELNGNLGHDELNGGNGSDTLNGGYGEDELNGGSGNDQLYGNAGTDVFLFLQGWGHDEVMDFEEGDLILFAGISGLNSIDDLTIVEDDDNMTISYGGNSVSIDNAIGVISYDDIDVIT